MTGQLASKKGDARSKRANPTSPTKGTQPHTKRSSPSPTSPSSDAMHHLSRPQHHQPPRLADGKPHNHKHTHKHAHAAASASAADAAGLSIKLRVAPRSAGERVGDTSKVQHASKRANQAGHASMATNRRTKKADTKLELGYETDSDLTEVPSENEGEEQGDRADEDDDDDDHDGDVASDDEFDSTVGTTDLEARLCSDEESLIDSDDSNIPNLGALEAEEESYLIEEAEKAANEAKARARVRRSLLEGGGKQFPGHGRGRGGMGEWGRRGGGNRDRKQIKNKDDKEAGAETDDEGGEAGAGSLRVRDGGGPGSDDDEDADDDELATRDGFGVTPDDLFFDGGFDSSSEPSFTDFFGSDNDDQGIVGDNSSDGSTDDDDSDDDSDDDDDMSEIEELGGGAETSTAPVTSNALAALDAGGGQAANEASAAPPMRYQEEVPLIVIEDLDGRLIYARARGGEAVFGSDGEFEFAESGDDDSDWEDAHIAGLSGSAGSLWGVGPGDEAWDDGDTTDELPEEDMPFPRLLIGSITPRGRRNPRAALLARNNKAAKMAAEAANAAIAASGTGSATTVDSSIPSPTASPSHGSASLPSTNDGTTKGKSSALGPPRSNNFLSLSAPLSPSRPHIPSKPRVLPPMGSFMPAAASAEHRAVIDGQQETPSPFSGRGTIRSRGTSSKRKRGLQRRESSSTNSSKRGRLHVPGPTRFLMPDPFEEDERYSSDLGPEDVAMDLDDILDCSVLARGVGPSSGDDTDDAEMDDSAAGRSGASVSGRRKSLTAGGGSRRYLCDLSRWDRIPIGAFRNNTQSPGSNPMTSYFLAVQQQQKSPSARSQSGHHHRSSNGHVGGHAGALLPIRILRSNYPATSLDATLCEDDENKRKARKRRMETFLVSPVLAPFHGGGGGDPFRTGESGSAPAAWGVAARKVKKKAKKLKKKKLREAAAAAAAAKSAGGGEENGVFASSISPPAPFIRPLPEPKPKADALSPGATTEANAKLAAAASSPGATGGGGSHIARKVQLPKLKILAPSPMPSPAGSPTSTTAPTLATNGLAAAAPASAPPTAPVDGHGRQADEAAKPPRASSAPSHLPHSHTSPPRREQERDRGEQQKVPLSVFGANTLHSPLFSGIPGMMMPPLALDEDVEI